MDVARPPALNGGVSVDGQATPLLGGGATPINPASEAPTPLLAPRPNSASNACEMAAFNSASAALTIWPGCVRSMESYWPVGVFTSTNENAGCTEAPPEPVRTARPAVSDPKVYVLPRMVPEYSGVSGAAPVNW